MEEIVGAEGHPEQKAKCDSSSCSSKVTLGLLVQVLSRSTFMASLDTYDFSLKEC